MPLKQMLTIDGLQQLRAHSRKLQMTMVCDPFSCLQPMLQAQKLKFCPAVSIYAMQ